MSLLAIGLFALFSFSSATDFTPQITREKISEDASVPSKIAYITDERFKQLCVPSDKDDCYRPIPSPMPQSVFLSLKDLIFKTGSNSDAKRALETRTKSCQNVQYVFKDSVKAAILLSVNYPFSYPFNSNCSYNISSPAGTQLTIECKDFNVACGKDQLSVSLTGNLRDSSAYCGKEGVSEQITTGNNLKVGFVSGNSRPFSLFFPYRYRCIIKVVGDEPSTTSTSTENTVSSSTENTVSSSTENTVSSSTGITVSLSTENPGMTVFPSTENPGMTVFPSTENPGMTVFP